LIAVSDKARPGRPARVDSAGVATPERLLDAAVAACVERGFEGVTMSDIARRAGVSTAAIYNHYPGRAQLLVAAGQRALGRITTPEHGEANPGAIVGAFLSPAFADTRRLLVELHLAGLRHPDVARRLAEWHHEQARVWLRVAAGPHPEAVVKTFFALLMGLCQIDSLVGVPAPDGAVTEAAVAAANHLFDREVQP